MDDGGDELGAIWIEHRSTTLARMAVLERAVVALLDGDLDQALCDSARREAHTLAGSIAFFGLAEAAAWAKDLEARYGVLPPIADAALIAELTEGLRRAVEGPLPEAVPSRRVLVVDPDPELADRLQRVAATVGVRIARAHDPESAGRELDDHTPDAALITVSMASGPQLIHAFADRGVPVIAVGDGSASAARVAAAAAGAATYLARSAQPAELIEAALHAAARQEVLLGSRILVIDDDPAVPDALRELLGWYGATVIGSTDPGALWTSLESARPDLLVLDVEMPGVSGIELCRALRADPSWRGLPVVFLTGTDDPDMLRSLFGAGADDCIRKPVGLSALADRLARVFERRGQVRAAAPGSGVRADVLVVDDDPVIADILLRALAALGHTTEWIEDGEAAAAALASPARAPKVVLLDVDLPGMDGYRVLARAAAAGTLSVSRVIMLTVRSSETEIVRALELGAFDHIAKPFSIPILMQRVRRALER